ncbi:MAG: hypothetical protein PPP56_08895 [Longimonas sp.]|uniref:hypothetical protein n=1 Tax=Longimonas sp. TaxID=2039626 RepID=UPI003363F9DE
MSDALPRSPNTPPTPRSLPFGAWLLVAVSLAIGPGLLMGCGASGASSDRASPSPGASVDASADSTALAAAYETAIARAAELGPDAIVTTLTPVAPHNDTLRWHVDDDGTRWVQVVTWTDDAPLPGASAPASAGDTLTLTGDVWTTLVPAIQQFCQPLSDAQRDRRLEQHLGLPPYAGYTRFVTLWASTETLFRPCPDPETTDRQCEPHAPKPQTRVQVAPEHLEWLDAQYAFSHQPGGYPFTGLGYTYDWGRPDEPVGMSEFVIPEGAPVRVVDATSTQSYCSRRP